MFQGYKQNFERNWKNLICIRVNNFGKSVNFKILWESSQTNLKLSKLEYYSSCWKVDFYLIHPTHITIHRFRRTIFSPKVLKIIGKSYILREKKIIWHFKFSLFLQLCSVWSWKLDYITCLLLLWLIIFHPRR